MEGSDEELMQRYSAGEPGAFDTLYARHRTALYRYLLRQSRDAAVTDDLFQETWSRVISSRERYQPTARFRTYLFHLAHNCFIDHYRRRKARPEVGAEPGLEERIAADEGSDPAQRVEAAVMRRRYLRALESLPAEQRDTFLLYEEAGLSLDDIGGVMGVAAETAKSRLRYAVAKLKKALASGAGKAPLYLVEQPE
ncbi:MAG: RNA polymerase sigma factor [Steroidobacteraceae bacterium]